MIIYASSRSDNILDKMIGKDAWVECYCKLLSPDALSDSMKEEWFNNPYYFTFHGYYWIKILDKIGNAYKVDAVHSGTAKEFPYITNEEAIQYLIGNTDIYYAYDIKLEHYSPLVLTSDEFFHGEGIS